MITVDIKCLAAWSSGMILVSGAGGRGFNSRSSPKFLNKQESNFGVIKINY